MHARCHSIWLFLSLLSLLGLVLAAGGEAVASTATVSRASSVTPRAVAALQHGWSHVPEYSSSPMIDQGRVLNSAGHAVSGAAVVLFPVFLGPKAGTVMTPLARATTDSSGHFTIRLPASRDGLLANSKSAGALNLHVMAFYPGGQASWFTPILAGAPHIAPSATLSLHTVATSKIQVNPNAPDVCVYGTPIVLSGFSVAVGYKSSLDTHLNYTAFSYTTGVSNIFGAGVSDTGPYGGFSASGTTTEDDSTGSTFPNMPGAGSNNLLAQGVYYDQSTQCAPFPAYWSLYQNAVGGDYGTPGAAAVSAPDCFTAAGGTPVTIETTKQTTFSQGVDLQAVGININLSSQDGYSSSATLTYLLGDRSAPYCGVHNWPGATQPPSPGNIQIHAES